MSDLGPINMKQHLSQQARELKRLERGMGGLMRPKPGQPSNPGTITLNGTILNDLSRYGSRLVVWSFGYNSSRQLVFGDLIATLPKTFRPEANVPINAWSGGGAQATWALLYLTPDGSLRFGSAGAATTQVSGSAEFTASL